MSQSSLTSCKHCRNKSDRNFCKHCGAKLIDTSNQPFLIFADYFFGIRNIRAYLLTYFFILRSPAKNTIFHYETHSANDALKFFEFSLVIHLAVFFSVIVIEAAEWLSEIIKFIDTGITYTVMFAIYYKAMQVHSTKNRSPQEYLNFHLLSLGFTLPIGALFEIYFESIDRFNMTPNQICLTFVLVIPLFIYQTRIWKYFWGTTGINTIIGLGVSFIGGNIAGGIVLYFASRFVPIVY